MAIPKVALGVFQGALMMRDPAVNNVPLFDGNRLFVVKLMVAAGSTTTYAGRYTVVAPPLTLENQWGNRPEDLSTSP